LGMNVGIDNDHCRGPLSHQCFVESRNTSHSHSGKIL
jgi:hypothetical protein